MRGYEDEYDDYLDEYETEGEEQEEGDEGGYEEEELQPPSREELEYLELRQKLKENVRKKMKKELGGGFRQTKKTAFPKDDFGGFFGPKLPVISQRVIQESKSLLENPNLAAKILKSGHSNNKSSSSKPVGSKPMTSNHAPKVTNVLKRKIEIKNTRDYAFLLSDDAELPGPSSKGPLTQKVSAPNHNSRPVQRPSGNQSSTGRKLPNDHEMRRGSQMQPKAATQKSASIIRPTQRPVDPRNQLGRSNGSAPGRHLGPKVETSKGSAPALHRPAPSKLPPSVPRPSSVQNRVPVDSGLSRPMSKQNVPVSKPQVSIQRQSVSSSRPQMKAPPPRREERRPVPQQREERRPVPQQREERRPVPQQREERRPSLQQKDVRRPTLHQKDVRRPAPLPQKDDRRTQIHRKEERRPPPARRPSMYDEEDDGAEAIREIRKLFRYNPNRYHDDDDDSDMEANFDEILQEERRSAKIARQEDDEELKKIEEEERRERMRKAKKRKLGHQ